MEQTVKEVRLLLQKKLNEVRQKKGIELFDIKLTDEEGKITLRGPEVYAFFRQASNGIVANTSNRQSLKSQHWF